MNSIQAIPRFERKFDEDRVENQPLPTLPSPKNALRTTQSAPISSIPRESILVRATTSLLTSTVDNGLMDIWVDDGTNGNIDNTVRLLRFSTAASAIDGILYSPKRTSRGSNPFETEEPKRYSPASENNTHLSPQASGTMAASSDIPKTNVEKPLYTDSNSQSPKERSEATEDVSVVRKQASSKVKQLPELLETEPVTPPRANGNAIADKSESPRFPKAPSLQHATSGSLKQDHTTKNKVGPAGSAKKTELLQESSRPIRRRLSVFFSLNDETPDVCKASQSSGDEPGVLGTKRESKPLQMNPFMRSSVRAVRTPPLHPAIVSAHSASTEEQTDGKRAETGLHPFESKLMPRACPEKSAATAVGKLLRGEGREEGAQDAEVAESFNADSSGDRADTNGSRKLKILNFLKRRSTVERSMPIDGESGSGRNKVGCNEQDQHATKKRPKFVMLVKKLSSGLREKKAVTSGKVPKSAAVAATKLPEDGTRPGTIDISERPANDEKSPKPLAQEPTSSRRSRSETLEQPTSSISDGQTPIMKGNRKSLWRLLKRFSSNVNDGTPEGHAEVKEEIGQENLNKGALFGDLFRRKSTKAEEKESETRNIPFAEGDVDDTPTTSSPPEIQTRWSQLSQKVTHFLGMLVH